MIGKEAVLKLVLNIKCLKRLRMGKRKVIQRMDPWCLFKEGTGFTCRDS